MRGGRSCSRRPGSSGPSRDTAGCVGAPITVSSGTLCSLSNSLPSLPGTSHPPLLRGGGRVIAHNFSARRSGSRVSIAYYHRVHPLEGFLPAPGRQSAAHTQQQGLEGPTGAPPALPRPWCGIRTQALRWPGAPGSSPGPRSSKSSLANRASTCSIA